jgi:hypothetical protein
MGEDSSNRSENKETQNTGKVPERSKVQARGNRGESCHEIP